MKHSHLIIAAGVLYLVCLALPVSAQNASLVGTARDAQQSVMPNVAITLTNIQTGVSQTTKTDIEGNYEFPVVRPGEPLVGPADHHHQHVDELGALVGQDVLMARSPVVGPTRAPSSSTC